MDVTQNFLFTLTAAPLLSDQPRLQCHGNSSSACYGVIGRVYATKFFSEEGRPFLGSLEIPSFKFEMENLEVTVCF